MTTISGLSTSNTDLFRAFQSSRGEGGISVDGNRISWAADGHYEVQSASSYNTMSEGGTSASLPHGTYNVINHTTGERYENVQVPSSVNARIADSSAKENNQTESTSPQDSQADSSERSGHDEPLLTITIPALTVNNELHLNNGVVIDIEELTGQPMTDVVIEVRPEDGTDNPGFGQGVAGLGLVGLGSYITSGIVSIGLGAVGVLATVIGFGAAFFDTSAKPTNPQTGHNSPPEPDNEFQPTGSATSPTHLSAPSGSGMGPDGANSGSGNAQGATTSGGAGTTDSAESSSTQEPTSEAASGSGMGPDGASSSSGSTTSGGSGTTDSASSSSTQESTSEAASGSGMGPDGAT